MMRDTSSLIQPISRRSFVGGAFATLAGMAVARESSILFAGEDNESENLYWGVRVTQHNGHCAWSSPIWVG